MACVKCGQNRARPYAKASRRNNRAKVQAQVMTYSEFAHSGDGYRLQGHAQADASVSEGDKESGS